MTNFATNSKAQLTFLQILRHKLGIYGICMYILYLYIYIYMPKCGRAPDGGTPAIHAHFVVGPRLLACDAVLIVIVAVSGVLRFRTLSNAA